MKLYTFKIIFFIAISILPLYSNDYVIAFGSCLDQDADQDIFRSIEKDEIDSFIFLGDNIYPVEDKNIISNLKKAYKKQSEKIPSWIYSKNIYAIWDDHDYGDNDGGESFQFKQTSQEFFLEFWKIPKYDERWQRDGIYFQDNIKISGLTINIIGLDTRFFRSDLKGSKFFYRTSDDDTSSILGNDQWNWLANELEKEADLTIILSSIQVLAENHRFEKWSLFPKEKTKLINMLTQKKDQIIVLSGDRHKAGIYQKDNIFEITSSSLNKPIPLSKYSFETDPLLLGSTYNKENYGLIEINSLTREVDLSIKDINGQKQIEKKISL